jgi:hypothetical protein
MVSGASSGNRRFLATDSMRKHGSLAEWHCNPVGAF